MAKAIKKKSVFVPQNKEELEQSMAMISEAEAEIRIMEASLSREIMEVLSELNEKKGRVLNKIKPLQKKINKLAAGVFVYAESHRV